MDDLLSVIVPAYNIEDYIEECTSSIQNQSYKNIEIIIVNDGSTDATGEVCERCAQNCSQIRIIHQENQGVMQARINGIKAASGKYITFVDGDDYIEPDMYLFMLDKMPGNDMVTCGVIRQEGSYSREVSDDFDEGCVSANAYEEVLKCAVYDFASNKIQRLTPWLVNKVFDAEIMKKVADDCEGMKIAYAEDSVMLYRYMLKCRSVVISKKPFYHYRYRSESAIHSGKDDILSQINAVYLALKDVFGKTDKELRLLEQLQKWVIHMTGAAFNNQMKFAKELCPIEFLLPADVLGFKKIAIYGAGKCGRDYMKQLRLSNIVPVVWVDGNYKNIKEDIPEIESPEALKHMDFDKVIIAVSREDQSTKIREYLSGCGIDENRVFWRKPVGLF